MLKYLCKLWLALPLLRNYNRLCYQLLGVHISKNVRIAADIKVIGEYTNICCGKNAEINNGCFLLAKNRITIGENTTLAYNASIITSANPNAPYNKLCQIYPSTAKPVTIGANVWICTGSIILPGVKIGDFCVVAAGSVVTKDVPSHTLVAGCPAKVIKKI